MSRVVLAASAAALAASACSLPKPAKNPGVLQDPLPPKGAQNWTPTQQGEWWTGSQGSRLIPLTWLRALEAPNSTGKFISRSYFDRFGYLWGDDDDELPIGFALDSQPDEHLVITGLRWFAGQGDRQAWVGLNCAACHTNRIEHGTNGEFIDGAPALGDFQGFTDALTEAMAQTDADTAKFDRFASEVLPPRRPDEPDDSRFEADKAKLAAAFKVLLNHQQTLADYNRTDIVYGHGRLDAVGHILNKVAFLNRSGQTVNKKPGAPQFRGEPDAPVSYPFIWNANQHDFVQWNGLVPNQAIPLRGRSLDIGALVRNTSEVIGVFAEVRTREYTDLGGYFSSVRIDNLTRMEAQLGQLMSPAWPESWGAEWSLKQNLIRAGKDLFERACADCHFPLNRLDLKTPIKAQMTPIWGNRGVGTDPGMVCNTFTMEARGGVLTGTKQRIIDGDPMPARAKNTEYLQTQAVGVLLNQKKSIIGVAIRTFLGIQPPIKVDKERQAAVRERVVEQPRTPQERLEDCRAAASSPRSSPGALRTLAYKARPLNGAWATAPFLHNGSVRSLYQLLLPPERRETRFWVGNHEFDPRQVGFVNGPSEKWPHGSWLNTRDHGSSNEGHDYKTFGRPCTPDGARVVDDEKATPLVRDFCEDERWALIEYMKSL